MQYALQTKCDEGANAGGDQNGHEDVDGNRDPSLRDGDKPENADADGQLDQYWCDDGCDLGGGEPFDDLEQLEQRDLVDVQHDAVVKRDRREAGVYEMHCLLRSGQRDGKLYKSAVLRAYQRQTYQIVLRGVSA